MELQPESESNGVLTRRRKCLSLDTMSPLLKGMEYAIRGPIFTRAMEISYELASNTHHRHSFHSLIRANAGDALAMGQPMMTFIRQVLACVVMPDLRQLMPRDVGEKAAMLVESFGGRTVASYSFLSPPLLTKHIAEFIQERDGGIPRDPGSINVTEGATTCIENVTQLFVTPHSPGKKRPGMMVPVTQYPVYGALCAKHDFGQVNYYLDEANGWALDIAELERAHRENSSKYDIRLLVVINPGNPTGQVLTRQNLEAIARFAYKHRLFVFADEVYQENVYAEGSEFHSFKKVVSELGPPYSTEIEVASFHTCSKGFICVCGMAGYVELLNVDPEVVGQYGKMQSACH